MSSGSAAGPILTLSKVTKRYGSFSACRDVSMAVSPGEVVGLLGQNGAGKSTLMKVLAGIETYETGEIYFSDESLRSGDHAQARTLGIAMVHQEFSLVGALTVWENIALALGGRLRRTGTIERLRKLSNRFGLDLEGVVDARVNSLSIAVRQRIEIAKCLVTEPRLILLDEPTAILSREEAKRLFQIVRKLAEDSAVSVLVSNHRLDEILDVTDRVAVLRGGRLTGQMKTSDVTEATLAREMLGADFARHAEAVALLGLDRLSSVAHASPTPLAGMAPGEGAERFRSGGGSVPTPAAKVRPARGSALEIVDMTIERPGGSPALDGLSLIVSAGEIVGLVGVEGNGQAELMDVLAGRRPATSGSVAVSSRSSKRRRGRYETGMGVVPADRHHHGCVLGMTVTENLFLGRLDRVIHYGFVRRRQMRAEARQLISDYGIQCAGPDAPMWTLSGGHQQRVVLARELARRPVALVVDQPTRGLDVAAVEAVWSRIRRAAREGVGVLVVSSDLVEVINLCSRVLVISRGAIKGELATESVDAESLGLLIGGVATKGFCVTRLSRWVRGVTPWSGYGGLLLLALLVAFAASLGLVAATGSSPMTTLADMWDGSVGSLSGATTLVNDAAPLLLVAAGTVVVGRAGLVNVGQEGQVLIGALAGIAFGLKVTGSGVVGDVGILVASAFGGACWVGIAAFLKMKARINETVSTLLLNYVAIQLVAFCVSKQALLQASPGSHPVTPPLPSSALLPVLASGDGYAISSGVIFAIVVAVAFVVVLRSTRFGYEVRVFGLNSESADSFGISRQRLIVTSLFISGATAGLAGGLLLSLHPGGVTQTFSGGVGWDGLLVALVSAYNPLAIVPVALGFGALIAGGGFVVASGVDATIAAVFQGMVALAVLLPQAVLTTLRRRRTASSTRFAEPGTRLPPSLAPADCSGGEGTGARALADSAVHASEEI